MGDSKTVESETGTNQEVPKRQPLHKYEPKKYKGKKLLIRFTHLEFPKSDLHFTYRGVQYVLNDSQEISLPLEVIEHLNSLAVPESKYDIDATTGQLHKIDTVLRHRFSCIPVNLAQIVTNRS